MSSARGFSLVELMITIVVLSILVGVGMPSFVQMLRNAEIRTAGEALVNGLQRARAEAVSRNASVKFVLGAGTATSYTVDYVTKPVPSDPAIDSRSSTEGSTNVTRNALASDGTTAATTITFNNLGQVIANADASVTLSRIDITATSGNQNLRVVIGAGGGARVCDPNLATGSSVRAC